MVSHGTGDGPIARQGRARINVKSSTSWYPRPLPSQVDTDSFCHLATLASQVSLELPPVHQDDGSQLLHALVRAGEPSVSISARTDDGRVVTFRHDEIRDWYGNVRLDHGYALTIAAAQGLTVDRAFLLADDRPARETIYPAGTRHREAIDVYVNRAPLALDVADRRADSDRDAPVTDGEIRAHLAERWSRSAPKEAALDCVGVGDREDLAEGARLSRAGGHRGDTEGVRAAANDNALSRIARDVRRTAFAWRHGAAVDAFAAGRQEVVAAWDELRARTATRWR